MDHVFWDVSELSFNEIKNTIFACSSIIVDSFPLRISCHSCNVNKNVHSVLILPNSEGKRNCIEHILS